MDRSRIADFLAPHLADVMPSIAAALPWLAGFAGAMIIGAAVAAACLTHYGMHLTQAEARLLKESRGYLFNGSQRALTRARRSLAAIAVLLWLTWMILWLPYGFGPAWTELVFSVISGMVLLPSYFAIRILELTFGRMAERLEALESVEER